MINTYSPYDELAAMPLVEWRREVMGGRRLGECDPSGGRHGCGLIRTDPRLPRRQERSVLSHELRHLEAGDRVTAHQMVNLRQEFLADTNAARLLVDVRDLADALAIHGQQNRSAVAVELRVADDVVTTRLKRLHPSEWHWLRGRLSEAV